MRFLGFFPAFIFVSLLILSRGVVADEVTIDAIEITINRFTNPLAQQSANVQVITNEQIRESAAKNVPQLLSSELGLFTTFDFYGNGTKSAAMDLRGFGAVADENTLILVDGRRLKNNDLSSIQWSAIPLDSIERIEVLRGSGGVLYGGGATAGAINIVTRSPEPGDDSAKIISQAGSFGTRSLATSLSLTGDSSGLYVYAQRYNSDNYRENNEERESIFDGEYRMYVGPGEYAIKFGLNREDLRLPGALGIKPSTGLNETEPDRRATQNPGDYSILDGNYVTLLADYNVSQNTDFVGEIGYRDRKSTGFLYSNYASSNYSNFIVTDTRVFHLSPRVKHLSKAFGKENELILGADLYDWDLYKTDTITPWGTTLSQLTMLDQRNVGVYVKDTIQISDKFLVTGGYRYENQKIDASDKDITSSSQDQNMSAYDFGGKYDLSDTVTFRASISKAFRTANADEVGFSSEYDTSSNRVFQFLRPQVSHTHEIGLDITDGNIYLKTALFQIDTKDEIRLENLTSGVGNTNYPFTQRRGVELRGGLDLSAWSLVANYAYTQAKFLTGYLEGQSGYISNIDLTDKTIPMVPRHRFSINAGKKFNDSFRLDSTWSYFSEQFMDNDESNSLGRQIPGFSVLDVKASMKCGDYSLALSVNNVLDREYYSYAVRSQTSGNDKFNVYPHAGRAAFLTLEYAFDLNR